MRKTERLRQILALKFIRGMNARTFREELTAYGSVEELLRLHAKALCWEKADAEIEKAAGNGIELIHCFDPGYPALLKEIFDPPMTLAVKGTLPGDAALWLAVVGSRDASAHGLEMAETVGRELAAAGSVVVSGLARGIDSAAHRGALAGGGRTVAVLGGGLLKVYPAENKKLAESIAAQGALVSEFPLDEAPRPGYFPMRNRIISGLSRGLVVVEAREKSGALITVDCALEQGREVYALPGNAGSKKSLGSNDLLREGAHFATGAADILSDFGLKPVKAAAGPRKRAPLNVQEASLLRLLEKADSLHLDEIVEQSRLSPQTTMTLLTTLTVKGVLKELPGKYFTEVAG